MATKGPANARSARRGSRRALARAIRGSPSGITERRDTAAVGRLRPLAAVSDEAPDHGLRRLLSRSWRGRYVVGLLLGDAAAALIALGAFFVLRPLQSHANVAVWGVRVPYDVMLAGAIPVWLVTLTLAGSYRRAHVGVGSSDYRIPVVVALQSVAVIAIGSDVLRAGISRSLVVVYFPSLIVAELVMRAVVRRLLTVVRRHGRARNRLVLSGDRGSVVKVAEHLARDTGHGFDVVAVCVAGHTSNLRTACGAVPVVGTPDNLVRAARALSADSVAVVGDGRFEETTLQQVAWQFESSGIDLLVAPDVVDVAGPRIRVAPILGLPLLHITEPRIGRWGRRLKPFYERLACVPLFLLTLPLFAIVALAVFLTSGRPIFYLQERVGQEGRTFNMIKFRTMVPDAEARLADLVAANEHDGALFKIRDDPRVTPLGRFLRKYSIDELPQLLNVLRGDMVLVGPRPCLKREMEQFSEAARRRFKARPGLTGLWQVSGRAEIPWTEAVRLDLWYVENWSPALDATILWRTLGVIVRGRGC